MTPPPTTDAKRPEDAKIQEFLQLCEKLRDQAKANGLTEEMFVALLAEALSAKELEAAILAFLEEQHKEKVKEFQEVCRNIRVQAQNEKLTEEVVKVTMLTALFSGIMNSFKAIKTDSPALPSHLSDTNPDKGGGRGR